MRAKQPLRRFGVDDVAAPDLTAELSNKSAISRKYGHVSLICPVCGISFTRKASEAKRHATSYCGKACAGFACRRQVEVECKACRTLFTVRKSHVGRITCCSEKCRRIVVSENTTAMDLSRWKSGVFKGGEKSSGAKLTEEQARSILADQRRQVDIAQDYGISRAAVGHLKRGRTWANLTDNQAR